MKNSDNSGLSVTPATQTSSQSVNKLILQAHQHHQAGRLRTAEELCHKVLAENPTHADANRMLGMVYIQTGRADSAFTYLQRALESDPDHAQGHYYLGLAFQKQGCIEEAVSSFEHTLQSNPSHINARMNLAITLKETGRLDEAVEHFRGVLARNPHIAQAHFHLATIRNHVSSTEEINAMKSLYNRPGTGIAQRYYLAFGLGTALEKWEAYEEAFGFFQAAHHLKKPSAPFNLADRARFFRSIMELFNREYLDRNRTAGPDDELPIFIFGMPRSGTTLAEQILASHPRVTGAGEVGYVEDVVRRVMELSGKPFLTGWPDMSAAEIHALGIYYLDRIGEHPDGSGHVTDTTPMNFVHIGLIATILPHARLIHCRRDPMDTCLSLYQQPLSDTHAYAHDLADLGGFYNLYREIMRHWHDVLPERIHDLCYEDLVTDSETEIRSLLDYCKLPFDQNCISFHKTDRAVRTPSASQVRQPMYTASMGRWRNYETWLSPLKALIG